MALKAVSTDEVLTVSRQTLGLPPHCEGTPNAVDDVFLAALVRHSAGFLCPCSAATLQSVAMESLQYLSVDMNLANHIDEIIETLTIGGDLLELSHATTNDPTVRGTWLFAAPPSYVVRPRGDIFLIGIVGDQGTYLPKSLTERISYHGCLRFIEPNEGEDIVGELSELGLQCLSEDNWLKAPRLQSAKKLFANLEEKLKAGSRSGSIPELQIINPERAVMYYRGRWQSVKKQTGLFVARRPQEYGSPIWCFVELQDGEAKKLLDFPLPKQRWRGCDIAWHLQMAIDYLHGNPQRFKVHRDEDSYCINFFSPLPLWAQRRLMIIGHKASPYKCLISFHIPEKEVENEIRFLKERLWMAPTDKERSL